MFEFTSCAVLISALACVSAGPAVKAIPCGGSGTFVNFTVAGCDGTQRCQVPIGTEHAAEVTFIPATAVDGQIKFQVWFYRPFGSVSPLIDIPLDGVTLVPGEELSLSQMITVADRFLDVEGEFDVVIMDSTGSQIICGEVPVRITAAAKTHK